MIINKSKKNKRNRIILNKSKNHKNDRIILKKTKKKKEGGNPLLTPWITLDKKIILINSIPINNFIIVKNYDGNFFAFIINSKLEKCNWINDFKKKLVLGKELYNNKYIYDQKFFRSLYIKSRQVGRRNQIEKDNISEEDLDKFLDEDYNFECVNINRLPSFDNEWNKLFKQYVDINDSIYHLDCNPRDYLSSNGVDYYVSDNNTLNERDVNIIHIANVLDNHEEKISKIVESIKIYDYNISRCEYLLISNDISFYEPSYYFYNFMKEFVNDIYKIYQNYKIEFIKYYELKIRNGPLIINDFFKSDNINLINFFPYLKVQRIDRESYIYVVSLEGIINILTEYILFIQYLNEKVNTYEYKKKIINLFIKPTSLAKTNFFKSDFNLLEFTIINNEFIEEGRKPINLIDKLKEWNKDTNFLYINNKFFKSTDYNFFSNNSSLNLKFRELIQLKFCRSKFINEILFPVIEAPEKTGPAVQIGSLTREASVAALPLPAAPAAAEPTSPATPAAAETAVLSSPAASDAETALSSPAGPYAAAEPYEATELSSPPDGAIESAETLEEKQIIKIIDIIKDQLVYTRNPFDKDLLLTRYLRKLITCDIGEEKDINEQNNKYDNIIIHKLSEIEKQQSEIEKQQSEILKEPLEKKNEQKTTIMFIKSYLNYYLESNYKVNFNTKYQNRFRLEKIIILYYFAIENKIVNQKKKSIFDQLFSDGPGKVISNIFNFLKEKKDYLIILKVLYATYEICKIFFEVKSALLTGASIAPILKYSLVSSLSIVKLHNETTWGIAIVGWVIPSVGEIGLTGGCTIPLGIIMLIGTLSVFAFYMLTKHLIHFLLHPEDDCKFLISDNYNRFFIYNNNMKEEIKSMNKILIFEKKKKKLQRRPRSQKN